MGGIFGGSSAPADAAPVAAQENSNTNNSSWGNNCAGATQNFTKCMDDNSGNMNICGWYLEQLVGFLLFPFWLGKSGADVVLQPFTESVPICC